MSWMEKHIDTLTILAAILFSLLWMNGRFNEIDKKLTTIKTILVWKEEIDIKMKNK